MVVLLALQFQQLPFEFGNVTLGLSGQLVPQQLLFSQPLLLSLKALPLLKFPLLLHNQQVLALHLGLSLEAETILFFVVGLLPCRLIA